MGNLGYREYYIVRSRDELILDNNTQHEALWPALLRLFEDHKTWSSETIIEGWALRRSYIATLSGDINGVFLLSDDSLIENRVQASVFSNSSSDPDTMIQKYIERSLWFNDLLRDQVAKLELNSITVSIGMNPADIAEIGMNPADIAENCTKLFTKNEKV